MSSDEDHDSQPQNSDNHPEDSEVPSYKDSNEDDCNIYWVLLKLIMEKDPDIVETRVERVKDMLKEYPDAASYKWKNKKRIDQVFECNQWKDIDGYFYGCHVGLTPLHVAAVYDCDEIAELLLESSPGLYEEETKGGNPLHYAAYANSYKVAKLLLWKNKSLASRLGNAEGSFGGLSPLHYAAVNDSFKVAQLLLEQCKQAEKSKTVKLGITPLHMAAHSNGVKVIKLLLDRPGVDVNCQDDKNDTPLHYAATLNCSDTILLLLQKGAIMGLKNSDGEVPQITAEVLRLFLDSRLIVKEDRMKKVNQADFEIKIDYAFLNCEPIVSTHTVRGRPLKGEDRPVMYRANGLIDDVIIGNYEKMNPENPCENYDPFVESELVWRISQVSEKHEDLLKHPVLKTFLEMKWPRVQGYYFFGLAYKLLFLVLLYLLIFYDYGGSVARSDVQQIGTNFTQNSSETLKTRTVLSWCVGITLLPLIFMEILQAYLSVTIYFSCPINFLQLFNIGITTWLVLDNNYNLWDIRRHFAAIILVFSVIEWIDFVGTHPTISPMVKMFYQVTRTFFNYLILYIWIIGSFGCSFYIMFHTDGKGDKTDEENIFNSTKLVSKTFVMFIGEMDYGSMPFHFGLNSIIQYSLFLLFLFMITVVLNNLMNGLAVSDTGIILGKAEIVALKEQAYLFTFWESFILGNRNKFHKYSLGCLTKYLPFTKSIFLLNRVSKPWIIVHPNPTNDGKLSAISIYFSVFTPGTYFIQKYVRLDRKSNGGMILYINSESTEQLKVTVLDSHDKKKKKRQETRRRKAEEEKNQKMIIGAEQTEKLLKKMKRMLHDILSKET